MITRVLIFLSFFTAHDSSAYVINFLREWSRFNAQARQELYDTWFPDKLTNSNQEDSSVENDSQEQFSFKNLGGEISEDIREIVDFIRNPEPFARVGAKMPKGILLYGPPGTGKTSIARAIAGEADAAFFKASGSDFINTYVGVGPDNIRKLFAEARAAISSGTYKKAIIFIDEIDAIGRKRTGETNLEYGNTLNALLAEMDGFAQDRSIFVIAATNYVTVLDEALTRPGRFDRLVKVDLPNVESREAILRLYCEHIKLAEEINFSQLAQETAGFSGADLENLVNEAAVYAARENAPGVSKKHLDRAFKKVRNQKLRR